MFAGGNPFNPTGSAGTISDTVNLPPTARSPTSSPGRSAQRHGHVVEHGHRYSAVWPPAHFRDRHRQCHATGPEWPVRLRLRRSGRRWHQNSGRSGDSQRHGRTHRHDHRRDRGQYDDQDRRHRLLQLPELAAGNYTITETQPTNYIEGKGDDQVGSQNSGTVVQTPTTNAIQNITLLAGVNGINNNFGNLGLTTAAVSKRSFLNPPPVLTIIKSDNTAARAICRPLPAVRSERLATPRPARR